MDTDTISVPIATLIAEGDPLTPPDWTEEREREWREQLSRVEKHYVELSSSNPLSKAKVEQNLAFHGRLSPGRVR